MEVNATLHFLRKSHSLSAGFRKSLAVWHKAPPQGKEKSEWRAPFALLLIFQAGVRGNDELLRSNDPCVTNRHYMSPDLTKKREERFGLDLSISSRYNYIETI